MLVFVDESGDTGRKTDAGSSQYFVVSSVIFEEDEEAVACDQRISLLKKELGYSSDFEFHFRENSDRLRKKFLEAVEPYQFFYLCVGINKDPKKLFGEGFNYKESFYKYACNLVFQSAKPHLNMARVKMDKNGSALFGSQLSKYIKGVMNDDDFTYIKSVKMEKSSSNNLLQLADYITGVLNRKIQNKKNYQEYYRYISAKELSLQIWPK
ncbi:MAG TPA: DUF3800 domain-containing protein [Candidatus Colwellbacteria bacterium]|nr:DUF3800 domain-containing protein [Candidatus Colwellbacteria bacterium]